MKMLPLIIFAVLLLTPLALAQEETPDTSFIGWLFNSITGLWENWFGGEVIETSIENPIAQTGYTNNNDGSFTINIKEESCTIRVGAEVNGQKVDITKKNLKLNINQISPSEIYYNFSFIPDSTATLTTASSSNLNPIITLENCGKSFIHNFGDVMNDYSDKGKVQAWEIVEVKDDKNNKEIKFATKPSYNNSRWEDSFTETCKDIEVIDELTNETKTEKNCTLINKPYYVVDEKTYDLKLSDKVMIDPSITLYFSECLADGYFTLFPAQGLYSMVSKWDIARIPAGSNISNVSLCMYASQINGGLRNFNLSLITNQGWDESIVNPNIAGYLYIGTNYTNYTKAITASSWNCFNITQQFNASYVNGDKNFTIKISEYNQTTSGGLPLFLDNNGLFISNSSITNLTFEDRENSKGTGNQPYININYTGNQPDYLEFTQCQNLLTPNMLYKQIQNINASKFNSDCIIISAANITLDCQGYSISSIKNYSGVYSNQYNTTVKNCNISMGSGGNANAIGIEYVSGAGYSNIINNTMTGEQGYSTYVNGPGNITISNNWINSTKNFNTGYQGTIHFQLYDGGNGAYTSSIIENNIIFTNASHGIHFRYTGAIARNNTITTISGSGIYNQNTNKGSYINNSINSISGHGIYIDGAALNNNLIGNNCSTISGRGISFNSASNNTLTSNTATSNSSYGIYLDVANNNILINQNAIGYLANSRGIVFKDANNNIIKDCINISGFSGDVLYVTTTSINNTFINCSYRTTGTNETVMAGGSLIRKWWYRANVTDNISNPVSGAVVSAYNNTGSLDMSLTTDSNGLTPIGAITEYVNTGGTRSYYSNHNLNATKTGVLKKDSHTYNVSFYLNNLTDYFMLDTQDTIAPNGTLISPSNYYTTNITSQNFTINISDNMNLTNATLYIYNESGIYNQTTVTYDPAVSQVIVGIVVNLVEGIYDWFYQIFDWTGNVYTTNNRTITINSQVTGTYYWVGANNGVWANASNWASSSGGAGGVGIPNSTTAIVFDSANRNNSIINQSIAIYSLTVSIGYNGTITQRMNWNHSINVSENVIISNGTLTHGDNTNNESWRVNMIVGGNFTVGSGGSVNVRGKGYGVLLGPGAPTSSYSGAGYGGLGGKDNIGAINGKVYGSIITPVNIGSGGNSGSGGGAVIINITGISIINGLVNANGFGDSGTADKGSPSGGSVFITTTSINGTGTISSNGATRGSTHYGGGGGGRIAVVLTNGTDFGNINLTTYTDSGTFYSNSGGAAGTIYLKKANETYGQLIIDNNGTSTTSTTLISENVTDTIVGDVVIRNKGSLNISAYNTAFGINPILTVYGNINRTSTGNLSTSPSGTLVLSGNSSFNTTIFNNETLENLKINKTGGYVFFPAGGMTNVTRLFTVTGNSSSTNSYAFLRSTISGTQWKLYQTNYSVNYVDAKDSNNTGLNINVSNGIDSGNNNNWTFLGGGVDNPPVSTLSRPLNNNVSSQGVVTFECNATDDINLKNVTLYVWNYTTNEQVTTNTSNWTGTTNTTTFTHNFTYDGNFTWNCLVYDNASQSDWDINRSLNISTISEDTTYPTFSFYNVSIINGSQYSPGNSYVFNITILNSNGTAGLEFNGTNYTMTNSSTNFTKTLTGLSRGVYSYLFWSYGNGTNKLFNASQTYYYTIIQNNSLALGITKTSPITYGTSTDFTGTGCPSQLTCSLNISNGVYSPPSISANYSTSGNTNYSASSAVDTITINKATSQTNLTFDKASPQEYGTAITPICSLITGVGSVSLTNGTSGVAEILGADTWNFNCSYAGNENYTASSNFSTFTINKNNSYILGISGTTPITYPTVTDVSGTGCPSQLTCSLDKANQLYGVGTVTFNYSTSGNANYTGNSTTKDIIINQNITTTTLTTTPSSPIIYPSVSNFSCSNSAGQSTTLYIDDVDKSSEKGLNIIRGVKTYTVSCNYTGNTNYSASSQQTSYVINQNTSAVIYTYLNNSRSNISITNNTMIWLNATLFNLSGVINLYNNGTLINSGTSFISNFTAFNLTGLYNITSIYPTNTNYSGSSETWWVNVSALCIESLTNTSWSSWANETCSSNQMNQSRFLIQYDSNNCGYINETFYQYQLVGPTYVNSTWSDWTNITCLINNTMNQSRFLDEIDNWGCGGTTRYYEYQNILGCTYTPPANVTTTSTPQCRYKKFGYYNLGLPWIKQEVCI